MIYDQLPVGYYLAEVSFYNSASDCPSSGIINTSTSSTTPTCSPTSMTSVKNDYSTTTTAGKCAYF